MTPNVESVSNTMNMLSECIQSGHVKDLCRSLNMTKKKKIRDIKLQEERDLCDLKHVYESLDSTVHKG